MKFIALSYSPWSEKARWALDYSKISYDEKAYTSMIGEPWLRLATRKYKGPVTVPVLIDGQRKITDSLDIAIYANSLSSCKHDLIQNESAVREWNNLSEKALSIGRYFGVTRQLSNKAAQLEILPPFIPTSMRPGFAWLAVRGLKFHIDKYQVEERDVNLIREVLIKLRSALNGRNTILDEFSYCDITMAIALQFVKPIKSKFSAQGPAVESCWTDPILSDEFKDLIEWRDWLYATYR